jgi:hypothetical protein
VASTDTNPSLRRDAIDAVDGATFRPVARPLDLQPGHKPSPRPRFPFVPLTLSVPSLPERHIWGKRRRERTETTPVEHTVQHLVAQLKSEHYNSDIQARLDAAEAAS